MDVASISFLGNSIIADYLVLCLLRSLHLLFLSVPLDLGGEVMLYIYPMELSSPHQLMSALPSSIVFYNGLCLLQRET